MCVCACVCKTCKNVYKYGCAQPVKTFTWLKKFVYLSILPQSDHKSVRNNVTLGLAIPSLVPRPEVVEERKGPGFI